MVQGTESLGIYRKNIFNPATMDLAIETAEDGTLYLGGTNAYLQSHSADKKLRVALEIIDTMRQIDEENDGTDDSATVDLYIAACNSEHFIFDYDWTVNNRFYEIDNKANWARELCEDCGDIPDNLPVYIRDNIDWDGVADDLLNDYSYCDLDNGNLLIWQEI